MHATVVESADTRDLKSLGVKSVSVQVRSVAPSKKRSFWVLFRHFSGKNGLE